MNTRLTNAFTDFGLLPKQAHKWKATITIPDVNKTEVAEAASAPSTKRFVEDTTEDDHAVKAAANIHDTMDISSGTSSSISNKVNSKERACRSVTTAVEKSAPPFEEGFEQSKH